MEYNYVFIYLFKLSYIFISMKDHHRATNIKSQSEVKYSVSTSITSIFTLYDSICSQESLKHKLYSIVKISKKVYVYVFYF